MNPVKEHMWQQRVLIITAVSPTNVGYKEQNQILNSGKKGMKERDLVIYRLYTDHWLDPSKSPLNEKQAEAIYDRYDIPRNTFSVVLIGKDGGVKMRKNDLVTTKEIFDLIDSMPMRQQEMRRKKTSDY